MTRNDLRGALALMPVLALSLVLSACGAPQPPQPVQAPGNDAAVPSGPSSAMRLAPGLYPQDDGTLMAVGTLEWRDTEGGFWVVIGGTEATGDVGTVVAVLAGPAKDDPAYAPLATKSVTVVGTKVEASTRQAGPEITAISITAFSDTPGAAE
jgi:hypothetical protein